MTDAGRALLERIMKLPPAERVDLAYEILERVESEQAGDGLTPEWREEVALRVERVLAGHAGPDEDWRLVLERVRRADLK